MIRLIGRDLQLSLGSGMASALSMIFFLLVAALVPFAVGPDAPVLGRIAAGMVWLAALLATLLTLERIFGPDAEDGTLDLLLASGWSAPWLAMARVISHWIATALPLIAATPLAALILGLPDGELGPLLVGLLVGTPALSALGVVTAALAVGVPRAGLLTALLLLPLMVPVLIFGIGGNLALLGAVTLVALAIAPFAAGAALRLAVA